MADEYCTTRDTCRYERSAYQLDHELEPRPRPPGGDGWTLVGSTSISAPGVADRFIVLWFWRRRPARAKTAPCKGCGALARKQGRCIGCGNPVAHA